ncbi:DUF6090 family protein [Mangrovimonas sp. DI 80]|uniref:DUF6090 family protein n=1 Tax=Mangrovimonas sp. DI 80 TaxID=1779330 RepID=UPI00097551E6|nr:DUF6090 family protein [Mangrovimonas sp. DI 80]OMP30387.1 hypothetical protein BKM32_13480 [Mangrovimonas sp. DI 80]
MMHLFSKIRYQLAAENKASKYMRYAIGEIVLVVIGILIALQINNWNENRKLQIEEQQILSSLLEDLKAAKKQSEESIIKEKLAIDEMEAALGNQQTRAAFFNTENPNALYHNIFWSFEIDVPVINTYEEIKSSGKTDLIRNKTIRSHFTNLERSINNLNNLLDDRITVHQLRIDEIVVNNLNFLQLLKSEHPNFTIETGPPIDFEAIMTEPRIRNLIGIKLELTSSVYRFRIQLSNEIQLLIELLEKEIDKP